MVDVTPLTEPYWRALGEGRLDFQRCAACEHAWLPPREECPNCLGSDWSWETASGRAKLVSWVVYQVAFNPAFAGRLPYNVAVVELAEGPRMITNIVNLEQGSPRGDAALRLEVQKEGGLGLARFMLV